MRGVLQKKILIPSTMRQCLLLSEGITVMRDCAELAFVEMLGHRSLWARPH